MIINTFNHEQFKPEFTEMKLEARGVVAIHTGAGAGTWVAESTLTFSTDGCKSTPYTVISGETFNVMYLPHEDSEDIYFLQPQTTQHILLPFDVGQFAAGVVNYLANPDDRNGIDVFKWLNDDVHELVEIQ